MTDVVGESGEGEEIRGWSGNSIFASYGCSVLLGDGDDFLPEAWLHFDAGVRYAFEDLRVMAVLDVYRDDACHNEGKFTYDWYTQCDENVSFKFSLACCRIGHPQHVGNGLPMAR